MSAKNIETEVKLYTPDLETIRLRLEELGAHLQQARIFERNVRYDDSRQGLSKQGSVLRLRADAQTRLTYKSGGQSVNGIVSRQELEVSVSDFDTMNAILESLGFHPYMSYEKYRTTYTLGDAEIVLDEMPYGFFTEIEGETHVIERFVKELNLTDAPRYSASYIHLFEHVRQNMGLKFWDLTFENFEGIQVPEAAFTPPIK